MNLEKQVITKKEHRELLRRLPIIDSEMIGMVRGIEVNRDIFHAAKLNTGPQHTVYYRATRGGWQFCGHILQEKLFSDE